MERLNKDEKMITLSLAVIAKRERNVCPSLKTRCERECVLKYVPICVRVCNTVELQ